MFSDVSFTKHVLCRLTPCERNTTVYEKHTMHTLVYSLSAYSFALSISDNEDAREHILYSGLTI